MEKTNKDTKTSLKLKLLLLSVITIGVLGLITYGAYFTFVYQEDTNVITSDCFSSSFIDGNNSITLTNTLPMSNDEGLKVDPYTFTLSNTCNLNSKYYIILNVKDGSFNNDYVSASLDDAYPTVLSTNLVNTEFGLESGYGTSYIIGTGEVIRGKSVSHSVRLFINESSEYTSGMTWQGQIKVVSFVNTEKPKTESASEKTLAALGLTANTGTPDFSQIATTDEGIFEAEDNYGTSYYFRGAVTNNYVKFGSLGTVYVVYNVKEDYPWDDFYTSLADCEYYGVADNNDYGEYIAECRQYQPTNNDLYWRIVRINGDGSLRLIYDGFEPYENGSNEKFGRHTFYNSDGAPDLNEWYENNLKKNGYDTHIADTIFCNDTTFINNSCETDDCSDYNYIEGYYGANLRLKNNSPSLKCSKTIKTVANGNLRNPIGQITADEVVMAGGSINSENTKYYLYRNFKYQTESPSYSNEDGTNDFNVTSGKLISEFWGYAEGLPVINLTAEYAQSLTWDSSIGAYTAE